MGSFLRRACIITRIARATQADFPRYRWHRKGPQHLLYATIVVHIHSSSLHNYQQMLCRIPAGRCLAQLGVKGRTSAAEDVIANAILLSFLSCHSQMFDSAARQLQGRGIKLALRGALLLFPPDQSSLNATQKSTLDLCLSQKLPVQAFIFLSPQIAKFCRANFWQKSGNLHIPEFRHVRPSRCMLSLRDTRRPMRRRNWLERM